MLAYDIDTLDRRQSTTLLTIIERGSKIARNSVYDSNSCWSTFVYNINVFDCRLSDVIKVSLWLAPIIANVTAKPSSNVKELCNIMIIWAQTQQNLSSGFAMRSYKKKSAQLQRLTRKNRNFACCKFWYDYKQITKALVRLCGCAGSSARLLSQTTEDRVPRAEAHMVLIIWHTQLCIYQRKLITTLDGPSE